MGKVLRYDPVALCVLNVDPVSVVGKLDRQLAHCGRRAHLGAVDGDALPDDTHHVIAEAHRYACSDTDVRLVRGGAVKDLRVEPARPSARHHVP